jgi:hypothetical protein
VTVRQRLRPAKTRGAAAQRGRLASLQRTWTLFSPVRTLAVLPLRSPAADAVHYVMATAVDVDQGEQRFNTPSTTVYA